jgi:hypothetical protein
MMAPEEWICAFDFDKWCKRPPLTVEYSFGQQVAKFPHIQNIDTIESPKMLG